MAPMVDYYYLLNYCVPDSLKLPVDSICYPPPDISFYLFRDVASVRSVVGPSLLLAHWQMNCELNRVTDLRQP